MSPYPPTGVKAKEWFIYNIDDLGAGSTLRWLPSSPRNTRDAMDCGCHSFDLVAGKVLARYTPDQNDHI